MNKFYLAISSNNRSSWMMDMLFISLLTAGLFFIFLGSRPLFVPDEGRYAEIAREMVASQDYLTPRLNDIKYFEKPVLFYWLEAFAIKIGGLNLWSIRSLNASLGLLGCLLTYLTARQLYNRRTGLLASLILAFSVLYLMMARMITLDLPVTFFLSVSLYSFILGFTNKTKQASYYFWIAAIAAALATLTKGLIGILFPIMIVGIWLSLTHQWQDFKKIPIWSCLILFLVLVLPWHLAVSLKNPEFFYFYIIEQHFLRYTLKSVGHYQPFWFFIPVMLLGFFPWVLFLPQSFIHLLQKRKGYKTDLFFWVWAGFIFVFFSFSKSKLIPYILPLFPPLAILVGNHLAKIRNLSLKMQMTVFQTAAFTLLWAFLILKYIDDRSILPLAKQLNPILKENDEVITYHQYYQDLPFYLERRVSVLNWTNELSYGMKHQNTADWMLNDHAFWDRFRSQKRVYVFMSTKDFKTWLLNYPNEKYHFLAKTLNTVLISNQEIPKRS